MCGIGGWIGRQMSADVVVGDMIWQEFPKWLRMMIRKLSVEAIVTRMTKVYEDAFLAKGLA